MFPSSFRYRFNLFSMFPSNSRCFFLCFLSMFEAFACFLAFVFAVWLLLQAFLNTAWASSCAVQPSNRRRGHRPVHPADVEWREVERLVWKLEHHHQEGKPRPGAAARHSLNMSKVLQKCFLWHSCGIA